MTSLTLAPDTSLARMRIVILGGAGGTLTRDGTPVRGGQNVTGDRMLDDYEAPFGVPLTYALDGATATDVLDVTSCWLTHPTDPTLNRPVTVGDDNQWQWEAPGTAHRVLGSSWPVVTHSRRIVRQGTLTVYSTWDGQETMAELLLPGTPLLLRVPPGAALHDLWLWPQSVIRGRLGAPTQDNKVRWDLTYQRVAAPGGEVTQDPTNSWAAVAVSYTDWAEIPTVHESWTSLWLTPHPPNRAGARTA